MLTGAGDTRGPARPTFDAFISYRSVGSAKAARQLQRALIALSKRHRPDGPSISLFLDTQSLVVGELDAELRRALENSRHLIVLLGPDTNRSPWVDSEIEWWLDHGGSHARLYLVRHDESVNLEWGTDNFADPESLPSKLDGLFPYQPKWLELRSSWTGTDETALVGLYAPIAGVTPDELLLAEADFQQRRQRRTRSIVSALSILLVLALIATGLAVVNWRNSEANRVRADRAALQARADANAAQALLAAADSAASGIRLGVEAASTSTSTSVRAALLAVADSAAVLRHAFEFPRAEAGYPGTGVGFSHDDAHLFSWGHAIDRDESYLVEWDLETGRREFAMRLDIPKLAAVAAVAPRWVAGCSDVGPVVIATATHAVRELAADWQRSRSCAIRTFEGGIVVTTQDGDADRGKSYFLDHSGQVTELDGMSSAAVRHDAVAAVVAGPGGVVVVRPNGVLRISDQPARTADLLDAAGAFAVRVDDHRWMLGRPENDGYTLTEIVAGPDAVDSAPQVTYQGLTGELAEVSTDGTVRMTGVAGSVRLEGRGHLPEYDYVTDIESVRDGFVVVFRDGATVLWPPGGVAHPKPVKDQPRDSWRVVVSEWNAAAAHPAGQSAVVGSCENRAQVFLRAGGDAAATWTVDTEHIAEKVGGRAITAPDCGHAAAGTDGIRFLPEIRSLGSDSVLRKSPVFDGIAVSADATSIAVIQAELPIEVLWTGGAVNMPWGARGLDRPEASTARGDRRLIMGYDHVTSVRADGAIAAWQDTSRGDVLAVHPAGTEILTKYPSPENRAILVTETGVVGEADRYCAVNPATYVPFPGFQISKRAAAQPLLVAKASRGVIDCHEGRLIDAMSPDRVVDYGIDDAGGHVLWRDDSNRLQLTDWRSDSAEVHTRPAPAEIARPGAQVFVSRDAIAGIAEGEGLLRVYTTVAGDWRSVATIPVTLRDVAGVGLADHGSLAVVVAKDATFEIFDIETGRRLIATHQPLEYFAHVARISIYESEGYITILVYEKDETTTDRELEIPITVPLLVDQLCTVYSAPACAGADR